MFEKEVGELLEICEKESAKEYTRAKMARREELEDKIAEFEIERDTRLENSGGSKRIEDPDEVEDPENQEEPKSLWDRPNPKKGTYLSVGPHGPGDLRCRRGLGGPY